MDEDEFSQGFILPPLITQLRKILDQYPDDTQILKASCIELLLLVNQLWTWTNVSLYPVWSVCGEIILSNYMGGFLEDIRVINVKITVSWNVCHCLTMQRHTPCNKAGDGHTLSMVRKLKSVSMWTGLNVLVAILNGLSSVKSLWTGSCYNRNVDLYFKIIQQFTVYSWRNISLIKFLKAEEVTGCVTRIVSDCLFSDCLFCFD